MQVNSPSITGLYNPAVLHNETTDDDASDVDEVDQLETESEHEEELAPESDYEEALREMGDSLLPSDIVEHIIDAEGVTGTLAMSKEALFVLSVASEEFMKKIANAAELHTITENRPIVSYKDIASVTEQYQEFFFLRDTIPPPLTVKEALRRREQKRKEDEENDPALAYPSAPASPGTTAATTQRASSSAQPKTKSRATAKEKSSGKEKEKANGSSSKAQRASTSKSRSSEKKSSSTNGAKGVRSSEVGAETPWTRWVPSETEDSHFDPDTLDPALSASTLAHEGELEEHHSSPGAHFGTISVKPWSVTTDAPPGSDTFQNSFSPSSSNPGRTIYSQKR